MSIEKTFGKTALMLGSVMLGYEGYVLTTYSSLTPPNWSTLLRGVLLEIPPSAYSCLIPRRDGGIRASSTIVRTGEYATVVIVDAMIYSMALDVSGSSVIERT